MSHIDKEVLFTLVSKIRENLTNDLRRPKYRNNENIIAGQCYVASEVLYWLIGGPTSGAKPMHVRHENEPHWWLKLEDGSHIDITSDQFKTPVPHENGKGKGFLTACPSKRAKILMERVCAKSTKHS